MRFHYRLSPAASCDTFCRPPYPRAPLSPAALTNTILASGNNPMYYSHQYVYWVNDISKAAFLAHGVCMRMRMRAYECTSTHAHRPCTCTRTNAHRPRVHTRAHVRMRIGHGIIDVETMLGVRADAHPASFDGNGDRLHFCQPGPADWAMDAVARHIVADFTSPKRSKWFMKRSGAATRMSTRTSYR